MSALSSLVLATTIDITPSTDAGSVVGTDIVGTLSNITFFFGILVALAGIALVVMKLLGGNIGQAVKTGVGVLLAAALLMNLEWSLSLLSFLTGIVGDLISSVGDIIGGGS